MSQPSMTKENIAFQKALAREFAIGYCRQKGLSIEKLLKQRIDLIPNSIVFSQPSNIKPQGLVNDMATMPMPTLIINFHGGDLSIEETEHTKEFL